MTIQSVDRAIDILSIFIEHRGYIGVAEISRKVGLSKATTFGLVKTMAGRKILSQDQDSKKYGLGPKLAELGITQVWDSPVFLGGVYPVQRLSEQTNASVRLYDWDGTKAMLILNMVHPSERFPFTSTLRPRLPANCTGAGKAILSKLPINELHQYLDENELVAMTQTSITDREELENDLAMAREQGVARDREEAYSGFTCFGVAITDRTDYPIGAVSISVSKEEVMSEMPGTLADELRATALEISHIIGNLHR